jgi:hypothetical protein
MTVSGVVVRRVEDGLQRLGHLSRVALREKGEHSLVFGIEHTLFISSNLATQYLIVRSEERHIAI